VIRARGKQVDQVAAIEAVRVDGEIDAIEARVRPPTSVE
jgi:hypothetical protein